MIIRTRESITREVADDYSTYDYLLLFADSTSRESLTSLRSALRELVSNPRWWAGRLAVVVSKVDQVSRRAFTLEDVHDLLKQFQDIPVLQLSIHSLDSTAKRVRNLALLATDGRAQLSTMGIVKHVPRTMADSAESDP